MAIFFINKVIQACEITESYYNYQFNQENFLTVEEAEREQLDATLNPSTAGPCYCCALNITKITVVPSEVYPSSFTATWDFPQSCNLENNVDFFEMITQWPNLNSSVQYHKGGVGKRLEFDHDRYNYN